MRINILLFIRSKSESFEFIDCGYVDDDSKCFAVLVQGPTMLRFDVIEAKPGEEEAFDARLRSILRYGNTQRAHVLQGISFSDADAECWANAIGQTLKFGSSKVGAIARGEYDIVF
jgi:hypothetical protein